MKHILVPTDFSENAKGALDYAQALAEYLYADIKLVHITHPSFDPVSPYAALPAETFTEAKEVLLDEFLQRAGEPNLSEVVAGEMVEKEVILGFAAEEIVRLSATPEVDMIVMGTKGKGGVLKKLFGSVSTHVAKHAHCPVLLIPEGKVFKPYRQILYASNYDSADDILLKEISDFAALFKGAIHLVHVNESYKKGDYQFEELMLEQLFRKKAPNLEIHMVTVQSENAWTGLNRYATENDIDMVVIATHHRKFWDALFHKSLTKQMVVDTQRPILVLPVEK